MTRVTRTAAALLLAAAAIPAMSQEPFRIGSSVGLSGYIAPLDREFRDGVMLAVDALNGRGGILGRKVELIIEDNRSQPQDSVIGYKKMIQQDKVNVFISGCLSAGIFAAASFVAQAELPMLFCSIPPVVPDQRKWGFQVAPAPALTLERRLQYLGERAKIRKIGLLHDVAPFSKLGVEAAKKLAPKYGVEIVGTESYNNQDADLSNQIGRLNGAGAAAIVKIGAGGTGITAAQNLKALGLKTPLLIGDDTLPAMKSAADVLGDQLLFPADPTQLYTTAGAQSASVSAFMKPWTAKHGNRNATYAASGWDAVMMVASAAESTKSTSGPVLRDAIEKMSDYRGVYRYQFSADNHVGITENPFVMARFKGDKVAPVE
jgi:branched-chain amino acid transport system substrate-binding protein